jgi:hypothetical protein
MKDWNTCFTHRFYFILLAESKYFIIVMTVRSADLRDDSGDRSEKIDGTTHRFVPK